MLDINKLLLYFIHTAILFNLNFMFCRSGVMVSCLYDPALFYTNQEYHEKTGETVDIQQEVESPELYLIARSSSSDLDRVVKNPGFLEKTQPTRVFWGILKFNLVDRTLDLEQLCYVDTRVECLLELAEKITTSYGIPRTDVMWFFNGDSPARQFECGSKKEDITTSQFVLFLPNVSLSSTTLSVANTVYYVPSRKAEIGIERPLWKEEFS